MNNENSKIKWALRGITFNILIALLIFSIPFIFILVDFLYIGLGILLIFYILDMVCFIYIINGFRTSQEAILSWGIFLLILPGGAAWLFIKGRHISKEFRELLENSNLLKSDLIKKTSYDTIDILDSGSIKFPTLIADLEKAKKSINIQYFIINDGIIWQKILSILIAKKKEGLDIRILVDYIGSIQTLDTAFDELRDNDIPFVQFIPLKFWKIDGTSNYRSHNKFVFIDDKIVYFGGMNIGDDYSSLYEKYGYWLDISYRMSGQIVHDFKEIFDWQWYIQTKEKLISYKPNVFKKSNMNVYSDGPHQRKTTFLDVLIHDINNAVSTIKLVTPYYVIPNKLAIAIRDSIKRGVNVDVITIGRPDKKTAYFISKFYEAQANSDGINFYRTNNLFIHSKFYIIDDQKITFGTTNLDFRALYYHFETNVELFDKTIINKFNVIFDDYIEISNKSNYQISLGKKIISPIIKLIAPMF